MKKLTTILIATFLCVLCFAMESRAQNPENWTSKQLMEPAELASALTTGKEVPLIVSVGPGATIPNSVAIGMVTNQENLHEFTKQLKNKAKDTKVVIYCGCCPFEHCPNVRPAINALKEMKFTNYYLLNLPHNIKTDWIDKGYPVSKS